jgi:hypothetical protein
MEKARGFAPASAYAAHKITTIVIHDCFVTLGILSRRAEYALFYDCFARTIDPFDEVDRNNALYPMMRLR